MAPSGGSFTTESPPPQFQLVVVGFMGCTSLQDAVKASPCAYVPSAHLQTGTGTQNTCAHSSLVTVSPRTLCSAHTHACTPTHARTHAHTPVNSSDTVLHNAFQVLCCSRVLLQHQVSGITSIIQDLHTCIRTYIARPARRSIHTVSLSTVLLLIHCFTTSTITSDDPNHAQA